MHLNSSLIFRAHALPFFDATKRVLELGPDDNPSTYRRIVGEVGSWTTADLHSEVSASGEMRWGAGRVQLRMSSEYEIPEADGAFDVVLSGQVIEHVRRPWLWMAELARVCAPGGFVITVNPSSWPYHEAPIDCWRMYPEAMKVLSADAGLKVVLSVCDSLEPRPRRWYPGASHAKGAGRRQVLAYTVKRRVGWPTPVSFDTITVAKKPAA